MQDRGRVSRRRGRPGRCRPAAAGRTGGTRSARRPACGPSLIAVPRQAGQMPDQARAVVEIYTDGACSGNPGPGGWGAVLRYGSHTKEICGGESSGTTNNRMELMAAIRALESLTKPATVRLHTDSVYLRSGITSWLPKWKRNGWRTSGNKPVQKADLWQRLGTAPQPQRVSLRWGTGDPGEPGNERADSPPHRGMRAAAAQNARWPDRAPGG